MKRIAAALGLCGVVFHSGAAKADVSSWVYVGSGFTSVKQRALAQQAGLEDTKGIRIPTLAIEAGMGSTPAKPLVLGGMFKMLTVFGDGTDLGLSLRLATRGFVTGKFGLALDAGPYRRFWGEGSTGGQAALVLGAPWGITLSVGGGMGSNEARHVGATLGLDFARLTVFRLSGERWFPNPHPAYRPKE